MRKQYLIDRKFQLRFSLELLVFVVVTPFIVWANIYMLGQYSHSQDIYNQGISTQWGMIGVLFQQRWWLLLLLYLVNFGLFYFIIVYYSHRVAGPIYKFNKTLDAIADGNLGGTIKLRKRDYFDNLGDSINNVIKSVGDDIGALQEAVNTLKSKSSSKDADLNKAIEKMDGILSRYNFDAPETKNAAAQEDVAGDNADAQTSS